MPKIKFEGFIEVDRLPDDRGSIDNWLASALVEAALYKSETGLEALNLLNIKWRIEDVPSTQKVG